MVKKFFVALIGALLFGYLPTYSEDFIENGINYSINSSTSPSVFVSRLPNGAHYSGDIDIPSSVTHNGIVYLVSGISNWAFENCNEMTSVNMPSTIKEIGDGAFYGCSNLSTINIPASIQVMGERSFFLSGLNTIESHLLEPFPISDDVFNNHVKDNTTLIVPIGTKELYQHTDGWKSIRNIKEFGEESGIENSHVNQGHIVLDGSSVVILGGSQHLIHIYDVSGRLIKRVDSTKEDIRIELHRQGTYIIQMGAESHKIII